MAFVRNQRQLFRFLVRDGWTLLREVARSVDHAAVSQAADGSAVTQYALRRDIVDDYNRRYEELKTSLKRTVPVRGLFGASYIAPLFVIRVLCVVTAATTSFAWTFLVSLLQFVVAPYSCFAAFAAWLGLLPFYIIHFATFAVLQLGTAFTFQSYPWLATYLRVPITPWLIVGWIAVDQAICLILCFWTPLGRPSHVRPWRLLQSVGYGFINCKTYWLVLLLSLRGTPLDLLALGLQACIPPYLLMRGARVLRPMLPPVSLHWTFSSAMFYHYHRAVHLPGAYAQAHRPHHYLLDSTPFDADMHGSGMPEEWLKLMTEISVCLATGLMPWSFTRVAITQSLRNKLGHTRLEGEHPQLDHFHVNHHTRHVKNFGYAALPLDLVMGTAYGDVSRMDNHDDGRTRCTLRTEADHYVLDVRRTPGMD